MHLVVCRFFRYSYFQFFLFDFETDRVFRYYFLRILVFLAVVYTWWIYYLQYLCLDFTQTWVLILLDCFNFSFYLFLKDFVTFFGFLFLLLKALTGCFIYFCADFFLLSTGFLAKRFFLGLFDCFLTSRLSTDLIKLASVNWDY
jgi:hypothetical protein